MADQTKSIEEREQDLKAERGKLEADRKAVQAERQRLEGVSAKDVKPKEPLKTGSGIYIPSFIDNITGFTAGSVAIGGISSIHVEPMYKRVEPTTNDSTTGYVASHVVDKWYSCTVNTEDFTSVGSLNWSTAPETVSFTGELIQNAVGTMSLTGNQVFTFTNCVFDPVSIDLKSKATSTVALKFHTLANTSNTDALAITTAA